LKKIFDLKTDFNCFDYRQLTDVNFINVLRAAFTLVDPKSIKNKVSHQSSGGVMMLGDARIPF
jgi:hypothetical protein